MALFRNKSRKAPVERPTDMPRDPFVAIAKPVPGVSSYPGPEGAVVLVRISLPSADRFYGRVAGWLHYNHKVRLKLDKYGGVFWNALDGERPLNQIVDIMKEQFDWAEDKCKESIIMFVKELMVRHFIVLEMPRLKHAKSSEMS